MSGKRWTAAESSRAWELLATGMTFLEVDEAIGRVRNSTYVRFRIEVRDDDDKRARFNAAVANSKQVGKLRGAATKRVNKGMVIPWVPPLYLRLSHAVETERAHAYSAAPTIGQLLLGEPPKGRSALDRRQQDVGA